MESKLMPSLRDAVLTAELDVSTFLVARQVYFAEARAQELTALAPEVQDPVRKALVADLRGDRAAALKALAADKGPWASYWHGFLLLESGRVREARTVLEQAHKQHAGHVGIACLMVEALAMTGDDVEARKLLGSLSISDAAERAFLDGVVLEREGEYAQALARYEESVAAHPTHRSLFRLGYLASLHGTEEQAIEAYEACVRIPPVHARAAINLGIMYEDAERYENAVQCYMMVLNEHPDHERAEMYLMDAEASLDMYYDREKEKEKHRRKQLLQIPVTDFELSVRSRNCLAKMNLHTLGDLILKSEAELLSYKNFGETSLAEIKKILAQKGFRLGQGIDDRPRAAVAADPEKSSLLNEPVSLLELSSRAQRCMDRLGIESLGDLVKRSELELVNQRNFGVTSLNEVKRKLKERGLSLAGG